MSNRLDIEASCLYVGSVPVKEATGNQVRRTRRMMELTQAELAKAIDVSRQTVVSIEGGDYAPSVYLALRLAEVLETTVEELFGTPKERTPL